MHQPSGTSADPPIKPGRAETPSIAAGDLNFDFINKSVLIFRDSNHWATKPLTDAKDDRQDVN